MLRLCLRESQQPLRQRLGVLAFPTLTLHPRARLSADYNVYKDISGQRKLAQILTLPLRMPSCLTSMGLCLPFVKGA